MNLEAQRRPTRCLLGSLAAAVLLTAACSGDSTPPAAPVVTVEQGVIALTPEAGQTGFGIDTPPIAEETAPDSSADASSAGDELPSQGSTAAIPAGAEVRARGQLRMYGTAQPTSPTLAEFQEGDLFTIMEPPGDVVVYPVELSGVRWYRVRAADGLVGWVIADGIELVEAVEAEPITN